MLRVPVLTYHAVNIAGNDYANNDHVAFAADLRLIDDLGLRIVPLHWVVDAVLGTTQRDLSRCVALSCDDGSDFDFHDLDHPAHGPQRSLYNGMLDFIAERGAAAQPSLHLTSFVIASPQARMQLDQRCLAARGWMNEDWWPQATASGLMAIECHSWEHNHPALGETGGNGIPRGSFSSVDSPARAEHEIAQAMAYLAGRTGKQAVTQFAFPFGQSNAFLVNDYLPGRGAELGLTAAWSTDGRAVAPTDDRWKLPRHVCGWHWKSPDELRAILESAA
ncbi:MAG: polysaccharide deacetylase family protein [Proteobacteria bacterium]|nr:polysaccharide deacetylase family protein [Pseudomonadota bacterium]